MMMVASHRLLCEEFDVTTYHHRLHEMSPWFLQHRILPFPPLEMFEEVFSRYDFIILQNTSHRRCEDLKKLYLEGKLRKLAIFYSHIMETRSGFPLCQYDRIFNQKLTKVENISKAISTLLEEKYQSKNNGLIPPTKYTYRKHNKRILVRLPKAWNHLLENALGDLEEEGFTIHRLVYGSRTDCLKAFAPLLYESGYLISAKPLDFHLSSNMQIPTITIANRSQGHSLLRPGWLTGVVLSQSALPFRDRLTLEHRFKKAFRSLTRRDHAMA